MLVGSVANSIVDNFDMCARFEERGKKVAERNIE